MPDLTRSLEHQIPSTGAHRPTALLGFQGSSATQELLARELGNAALALTIEWCDLPFPLDGANPNSTRRVAVIDLDVACPTGLHPLQTPALLVATVNAQAMRLAHTLSRQLTTELFLLDTDPPHRVSACVAALALQHRSRDPLEALSPPVRHSVLEALHSPTEWSVKRIAAESGVSRRTLERLLARAHLPTPGTLLKQGNG